MPAPPDVADTFPSDEDPDTGLEVHQLTTGEGVTDVQDHYTGYYHHDPLYGDWVVTWTVAASGKRHYKTNVRTGERVPLAGWNGMTGIQVRGADLFTTRVDGPDRWLAALDLDAMTWTDHGAGTHDDPWRISGSLAVDPAGSHVLAYEAPVGRLPSVDGPEHRTRHHDLEAGTSTVVRESPHLRNHYEFSPAGDGTFRAINEWIDRPNSSRFGTERFVVGHVDRHGGRGRITHVELDAVGRLHEESVPPRREVEGDVLVRPLGLGAPRLHRPRRDRLAPFVQRRELLAQSVDVIVVPERETRPALRDRNRTAVVFGLTEPERRDFVDARRSDRGSLFGEEGVAVGTEDVEGPLAESDLDPERRRLQHQDASGLGHREVD